MSLLDILLNEPSAAERFQQIAPLINGGGVPGGRTPGSAPVPNAGGSPSHWESVARRMAANRYGYTPEQLNEMDYIISHESGWNPQAVNDSSGAYGIPQILPSAHPGLHIQDDPRAQIKWFLNYVNDRYGGIDQAYQFKQDQGWY
jgi:hypothetical protein